MSKKNKITQWIKENIGEWTVFVAIFVFLFGPFLQSRFTGLLEQTFPEEDIAIFGCNPIQNSLMVVTSENGSDKKIHSASNAPFMMSTSFALVNRAQLIQKNSRIYIGFLNEAENSLTATNFLSTNRADIDKISAFVSIDVRFFVTPLSKTSPRSQPLGAPDSAIPD